MSALPRSTGGAHLAIQNDVFDDIIARSPHGASRTNRWMTGVVSASAHVALVAAVAIPALFVADALPEPRTMMAFVASAPIPPPPPPPAPVAPAPPEPTTKHAPRPRAMPRVVPRAATTVAAPVEAPVGIAPETGLEGNLASGHDVVQPGFEGGIPGGAIGGVVGGFVVTAPPPPPPAPSAPVRVGGAITAPRLVHGVSPEYPPMAQRALVEGIVILEATVDRTGHVKDVRVLRSHALLEQAAIDAVEEWVYEPLMLNGQPEPFVLTVSVSFSLAAER